jgi:hypothetical protein
MIKALDSADKSNRSFLDQVLEWETSVTVSIRERDHESEVCFDQLSPGVLVSCLQSSGESLFLCSGEERNSVSAGHEVAQRNHASLEHGLSARL